MRQVLPAGQTLYGASSGASHSCAAASGAAALVYQDFLNKARPAPSPAMLKAYLMNSAAYLTGVGGNDVLPSNGQGMGRIDLGRAFDGVARILVDQTHLFATTGETYQIAGNVSDSGRPVRITLAYSDAPGPTTGGPWVNNPDLEVDAGGTVYKGNVFASDYSTAGGSPDTKNNVESVYLPAGTSGPITVTVRATNIAGDGVPGNADTTDQDFALVFYNATEGAPPAPVIAVSPTSYAFTVAAGSTHPNDSLSITNMGGGTLAWTATDDATWLSVSPASGTAPSTPAIVLDTASLAAGTYNATIMIGAAGATNSPVSIPVTLSVTAAPPAIAVSPSSLSFTGVVGGPSPASQSLAIANAGGGTLAWSANEGSTWVSISPATGTAPSTVTASVDTTGLAAGSYSGAIAVTGASATNSPVSVPITLTMNAATPELVVNGGFEGTSAPWSLSGWAFWSRGGSPHSGQGYVVMGGVSLLSGRTSQRISIPASATSADLTFWLGVTSSERTTTAVRDRLFVEVRSTTGALLQTVATYSNLDATSAGNYQAKGPFSLLCLSRPDGARPVP